MRAFDPSPRAAGPLAALALITLTLPGCGGAPTAPESSRSGEVALRASLPGIEAPGSGGPAAGHFYPLDLGNHWGYDHSLSLYIIPTSGPPGPVFGINDRHGRDIVCVENRAGQDYTVERESYPGGVFSWVRYRQDGAGLFEADVDISLPPACSGTSGLQKLDTDGRAPRSDEAAWDGIAAKLTDSAKQAAYRAAWERIQSRISAVRQALGREALTHRAAVARGLLPGEITRLEYPLHPGAHWAIREDPPFESTVEGAEVLDLAMGHLPGWRIRLDIPGPGGLGPSDRVHFWFGRSGFLQFVGHFETPATDATGNVIGTVIGDESEVLTDLALAGGRFATP